MMDNTTLDTLAYAQGKPLLTAVTRQIPEDFRVEENLGFAPDGEGEHVLVQVSKRDANTEWVARQLATACGVPPRQVSYAGLKDRHAVTTQWFSIHLGNQPEPDWTAVSTPVFQILHHARHRRKLRRGTLQGNRFTLVLRNVATVAETTPGDTNFPALLENRLRHIQTHGVPNYFGPQRFGHNGQNIARATAWFTGELKVKDRHQRSLYLSAARSFLFNQVLSRRLTEQSWCTPHAGDVAQLAGSHSVFAIAEPDRTLQARLDSGDIHLSGPLWGKGKRLAQGEVAVWEDAAAEAYPVLREGLEKAGLEQERRALRMIPENLTWRQLEADNWELRFSLPAGGYASAVLRELVLST